MIHKPKANKSKMIPTRGIVSSLLILCIALFLSACSPHPGAGSWSAKETNPLNISRINVVFEGTADMFTTTSDNQEVSIRRCFWSAEGEQVLQMQCVHSDNTDNKETFQFTVDASDEARLTQNDQLLGLFIKQTP